MSSKSLLSIFRKRKSFGFVSIKVTRRRKIKRDKLSFLLTRALQDPDPSREREKPAINRFNGTFPARR